MSAVVADTSVWIEFLAGRRTPELEAALSRGAVILPPVVVAELVSGARKPADRAAVVDLVAYLPVHDTPVDHWVRVGELRRKLLDRGVTVSTPDAHVAQCALDGDAVLLTRDRIFTGIARVTGLRVAPG